MKYCHIFFDLDRTLWDFDAAAEVAFERIYDQYHLKDLGIPSAHEFHEVYHPLNEKLSFLVRRHRLLLLSGQDIPSLRSFCHLIIFVRPVVSTCRTMGISLDSMAFWRFERGVNTSWANSLNVLNSL